MLNLRLYAAPLYNDLPGKLRPKLPNLGPGPNKVVVARLKHSGHSTANPRLYEALGFTMSPTASAWRCMRTWRRTKVRSRAYT